MVTLVTNYLETAKVYRLQEDQALAILARLKYRITSALTFFPHIEPMGDTEMGLEEKAQFERIIFKENRLNSIKSCFPRALHHQLYQYFYNEMTFENSSFFSAFMLAESAHGKEKGSDTSEG